MATNMVMVLGLWSSISRHRKTEAVSSEISAVGLVRQLSDSLSPILTSRECGRNAIQPTYALQAAAYAHAVEERFGEPVVKAVVVRIGKTRERDVEEAAVADLRASFGVFHALLIGHAHLQRQDAPTLFSASRVRLG